MTPMVDVVMCILIFFMLGSSFIMPELFLKSTAAIEKNGLGTEGATEKLPSAKMNIILQIEKVSGDEVDVRLVHPLAEKDLKYTVEVVNVTDPRPPPMPAKALALEPEEG